MFEDLPTKKQEKIENDVCLISTGRIPYVENLGLENLKIAVDKDGKIKTDKHLETNVKGIYAIGDVVDG